MTQTLGTNGPTITSPGLGGMSLSGAYGPTDDQESIRVVRHYLDSGGTLIDTADFYAAGGNEMLVARALRGRNREEVVLSVKFGALLTPGGMPAGSDGRPVAVKNSLTYSLQRLRTDHVDIYRPARLDPQVPIEETVGAIQELVEAGYVRHIGLSEVGPETIRRAAAVAPISDLQIEYSLLTRDIESNQILQTCRELGIGITAYGVLAKGLLAGRPAIGNRAMFPGSRERTWSTTRRWSHPCSRSPRLAASRWHSWRSPGSRPRARTSSRSSVRVAPARWSPCSAPATSHSAPRSWTGSARWCPRAQPGAPATRKQRWPTWTASAALADRPRE